MFFCDLSLINFVAWLQAEGIIPTGARTSAKGRSTLTSDVAVDITPRSVSPGDEDAELLLDPEEAQQLRKLKVSPESIRNSIFTDRDLRKRWQTGAGIEL